MILDTMNLRIQTLCALVLGTALATAAWPAHADKKPQQDVKPMAGPRAAVLRVTWLYISPDTGSQKVAKVQVGREMVVAEKNGTWFRVFANTDIEEQHSNKDTPMVGEDTTPPPVSGWMEARGIVEETTPNGDQILMGAAANQEALASNPRGPANAARSARSLYRRVEMFPNSAARARRRVAGRRHPWQSKKPTPHPCRRRMSAIRSSARRWTRTPCARSSSTIPARAGLHLRPST